MTLYDNSLITVNDCNSNFFAKKEDIDENSRADVTQRGLMEINNSALIMIYKGELSQNYNELKDYQIIIITEIITMEMAESLNQYCRNRKKAFIYTAQFGLSSFLFSDFGDDFIVEDLNGKESEQYFIKSITNSCPGIVEIEPIEILKNGKKIKKYLKLGTGDFVTFKKIKGMNELNDTPPRPIRVLSNTKFTIEDTSKFQEFLDFGIVEEVKIPYPLVYKPLSEAKDFIYCDENNEEDINDEFNCEIINDENHFSEDNNDNDHYLWIKMFNSVNNNENFNNNSNELMHLAVLTLHEFFNKYQFLPHYSQQKEIDECIEISLKIFSEAKKEKKKWVNNIEKIDKIFLTKICKFSKFNFVPMTYILGGIISQEILKYIGLYKPSNQWVYFNFLNLINEDNLNINIQNKELDDELNKNLVLFLLFGKEKINQIKNTNILIIGLNDIGYEIVRIFIMLDLFTPNNNIIILEDNKNQIDEKMNDLEINGKNNNIKIISEHININDNLSEKDWWKNSIIIIDTLSYNINPKEKVFIIKNSKKDNKILFDINISGTVGSYELILPKELKTIINNNKEYLEKEKIDTPEGPNENEDKNRIEENIDITNEKNEEYKNIYSLEESLIWSKKCFENYFIYNIKYLNELVNKSDSEKEMENYLNDLIEKENNNENILKLIRTLKKLISLKLSMSFELIVFYTIEIFQELFEFSVDEILQKYPSDLIKGENGKKYWSGKRPEPIRIKFDINNEEHYQFIYCITYFLCHILEFEKIDEKLKNFKIIAESYVLKQFDLTLIKKANNSDFFNIEKISLIKFLGDILKVNKIHFKELEINYYENIQNIDDIHKINNQIKFIILASNIKLNNYGINNKNINDSISLMLKINNYLPSVLSSISGLVVIQLFNMFNDIYFLDFIKSIKEGRDNKEIINDNSKENLNIININKDDKNNISFYKNSIFNLASNIYLLYDINDL